MPLTEVYNQLQEIKKENSQKGKIELLKKYLADPLFHKVVNYTLDQDKMFHIKNMGPFLPDKPKSTADDIFHFLLTLSKQKGATKEDRVKLQELASTTKETHTVVVNILKKDLKCGANAKLINKAEFGAIFIIPYMRCSSEKTGIKKINYPAIVQKKADGAFCYGMISKKTNEPILISRNGLTFHVYNKFDTDLEVLRKEDQIISMELLVMENGKEVDRSTGNGILHKAIRGTLSEKEANMIYAQTWDIVPQKDFWVGLSHTDYEQRWRKLTKTVRSMDRISRIQSRRVASSFDAARFFTDMREKGHEGAVLKNLKGKWKFHTSPDQVKMKHKAVAEFIIIGWNFGEDGSKYEHCLGSLSCISEDGGIRFNVGSGFTDNDRGFMGFDDDKNPIINQQKLDNWSDLTNHIVSIEFDSVIKDKKMKTVHSLFLPVFQCVRFDKTDADTLAYCQKL